MQKKEKRSGYARLCFSLVSRQQSGDKSNVFYIDIVVHYECTFYCYFIVVAQQGSSTVIAHPGQDVELLCDVTPSGNGSVAWMINNKGPHGLSAIRNDIVPGYTNKLLTTSLIIESIMMDDDRNDTEHQCVIGISDAETMTLQPVESGIVTILYVAGEW